ncbi:Defective in cullin neddylation protein [Pleurotus pulmonarius]
MPPKRKRAEATAASTSTRSTRSSTRNAGTSSATQVSNAAETNLQDLDPEPPVKKPRAKATTTKATTTKTKAAPKAKGKTAEAVKDQVVSPLTQRLQPEDLPSANGTATPRSTLSSSIAANEYTPALALATFGKYADEDNPEVIGPESFSRLCEDADVSLEGALPLIIAWQMDAGEMGKITKEEWTKGTSKLQIASIPQLAVAASDLDKLLIQNLPPPPKPATANPSKKKLADEAYDRTAYWQYAADSKAAFKTLYSYCFTLAKSSPASRSIEKDTATAFWAVLLAPQYPIVTDIVEFVNEKANYKGINKDVWSMILDFCHTVKPDLSGYEADGAWPSMLDEFVQWKKEKSA